jgi:hypothetical protein
MFTNTYDVSSPIKDVFKRHSWGNIKHYYCCLSLNTTGLVFVFVSCCFESKSRETRTNIHLLIHQIFLGQHNLWQVSLKLKSCTPNIENNWAMVSIKLYGVNLDSQGCCSKVRIREVITNVALFELAGTVALNKS